MAVGAVHHHLIKTGQRSSCSLVVETSTCFSTHHAAMLIGYGAHAVCPFLAYETCRQWRASARTAALIKSGKVPDVTVEQAQKNFKKSVEKGILKILSKMGISLLQCYHGAQVRAHHYCRPAMPPPPLRRVACTLHASARPDLTHDCGCGHSSAKGTAVCSARVTA